MKQAIQFTQGSLPRQILRFSFPLIASNLLQVFFHMSDLAVVGQFSERGAMALGEIGSTALLITLLTGFLIGIGGGINVLVAQYYGARNTERLEKTVHTTLLLSAGIGVLLLVASVSLATPILQLLGTHDELIDGAVLYFRLYALGMPALAIYNYGNAVLSAAGDTKRPLYFMLTAGILNVLLNLFFVIVCRTSVEGVALASVISQYVSAVLVLWALFRAKGAHALSPKLLRIDRSIVRRALGLGLPSGLQNALFYVANLFVQACVNSLGDPLLIAGNSAAQNSDALVFDVMTAFYTACASFIGQNFGAGKRDRILKTYFICLAYSFGIAAILSAFLVGFGGAFLSIFTSDPTVIEKGMARLIIMGLCYPISALMDNTLAAARGIGKTAIPTFIVIMGSVIFRLLWLATVFLTFRTIESIYLLYPFSWLITGVAEIWYFRHAYRSALKDLQTPSLQTSVNITL